MGANGNFWGGIGLILVSMVGWYTVLVDQPPGASSARVLGGSLSARQPVPETKDFNDVLLATPTAWRASTPVPGLAESDLLRPAEDTSTIAAATQPPPGPALKFDDIWGAAAPAPAPAAAETPTVPESPERKKQEKLASTRRVTAEDREWASTISADPAENAIWDEVSQAKCDVDFSAAVAAQLAPFKEGVTQGMLDGLYCVRKQVARVRIWDGTHLAQENWQLTMDHSRLRSSFWLLQLAMRRAMLAGRPFPDVEFIVNPTDKTSKFASGRQQTDSAGQALRKAPLFCNAKCDGDHSVSFPLYYHMLFGQSDGGMSLKSYKDKYAELVAMGTNTTWAEKKPKMFFSATNTRGERANLFSMKSPHLTTLNGNVALKKYADYRYSIYTVGHSGWSRRLRELMFFNTTLFMEDSDCHEFIYHTLTPDEDFTLVKHDLSDVPEKLAAAAGSDAAAERMAGKLVAKGPKVLSMECLLEYIDAIIRGYADLQLFEPHPRRDWTPHEMNSTAHYFLDAKAPSVEECRPYF